MEVPLLRDLFIIFAFSIAVLSLFYRLRVPSVVGFLLTGIAVGPNGLKIVDTVHEVEILAEVGIILLLFTIGIEFSLKSLLRIKRFLLIGGSLQGALTYFVVYFIALKFGLPVKESVLLGFLISFSSTAIVLKILQERAEIDSPHGRIALAILIFQDIIIVPIMLVIPFLAGIRDNAGQSIVVLLLKGIGIILFVFLGSQWIVPKVLFQITKTRSRELFILSILVICFAVAWLTSSVGLSLALGAFLAGLILSESEYSLQALSNILPFRDVFTSLFFVSIGMLFNVSFFFQHLLIIVLIVIGVVIAKAVIAGIAVILMGFPLRTALLVGLSLSQVGEFAFVLASVAIAYGVFSQDIYQYFLSLSIITMATTPFIITISPSLADLVLRLPIPNKLRLGLYPIAPKTAVHTPQIPDGHIIIVGFGLNGRNVAMAAKAGHIPYVVIEMNPETVRSERAKGEPIFYGDASQREVLEHTGIKAAKVLLIVISDPAATRRVTELGRKLNPAIHIITRTRFFGEVQPLYDLGADEVVPEEFETSIQIFARVLVKYDVPTNEIEKLVATVRSDGYGMFRSGTKEPTL
ncbi:MAG: cation:proton antiporter [Pseudomonadota bacterium]